MNTGKKIETERLLLVPGSNARDDAHFIHMLRNDGDFRDFWNPFMIDRLEITTEVTKSKSMEYWSAMEALSDYLAGNTSQSQEELVLRTARTYAKCKRKVSETGRIASEGTRVQDILW